ncbi:MAG: hypothetical protein ACREVN_05225 [Gammaproteobacteria bacterium]
MRHRPGLTACLLLGLLGGAGAAQGAEGDIPEADVVLHEATRAIGANWGGSIQRLATQAIVSSPEGASRVLVDSAYSDRLSFEQRYFDGRYFAGWINGEAAWYRSGNNPALFELDDGQRRALRANQWHVMCLGLEERFSDFEAAGREAFAGQRAIKLSMRDASGQDAAAYFDPDTFMPLGLRLAPQIPDEPHVSIHFEDWRDVEGIRLFHQARVVQGPRVYRYVYTDIDLDPPGDDPFEVPAAIAQAP